MSTPQTESESAQAAAAVAFAEAITTLAPHTGTPGVSDAIRALRAAGDSESEDAGEVVEMALAKVGQARVSEAGEGGTRPSTRLPAPDQRRVLGVARRCTEAPERY